MKKKNIITLLLALIMVFSLCACGGGGTANASAVGDTVSTDWAEFTLKEANVDKGVGIEFSIKNIGNEDLNILVDGSKEISSLISVVYDDYVLEYESSNCYSLGENGRQYPYLDLPVLSDAVDYKAGMLLPDQVVSDTEAELFLQVKLPTSDGGTELFMYKIR